MATTPDAFRVAPTVPSRPSKLIIFVLAAFVVGFFVLAFSQSGTEVGSGGAAPAATQQD